MFAKTNLFSFEEFVEMEKILALRILKTITGIVGILGNGLICVVICKVSAMQTRTNAFIFHQAVVDFLGSTMILVQSEIPLPDPLPDNGLGWVICNVWLSNFTLFFVFVVSTFNLLAVTMERYFAIVHPFRYQAAFVRYPRVKVGAVIVTCWLVGAAIKPYLMTIFEIREGSCRSLSGSKAVGILTAFLQYILPVGVMFFAYIRISVELKRGAARVGPPPPGAAAPATEAASPAEPVPPDMGMRESLLKARRNIFKTLLTVFITFLVCWTPNQVIFLSYNLGLLDLNFKEWYYLLSVAMVAANCCVNPFIYVAKYRHFRNGLRQMLCGNTCRSDTCTTLA
ncbi:beta-1 adrenergic receptor-like [Acanthaster planci]|uniref:Beta-1 adrenergic receptor-like n=1 Tax=Acanthaster planci TaxID=133434 RepID=A0A8B7ZWB1_ACAPL|nr:beta-1 adrenergic receptor-like [Acanthaster planci]